MIAFMLLRTILLVGVLTFYSIGMFRLINQFFGERYQSYLQDELTKKPHMKNILNNQEKVTTLSSSTTLVNKNKPSNVLIENENFNVDTCRKIDGFYEIIITRNLFCKEVDTAIVVTFNDDNDNKLLLNGSHYKNADPSDKNVILKYEHINESNNDNIKKIQLKKMLSVKEKQSKNDNEKQKYYNHVKNDNAEISSENEGKIKNYEHQECYSKTRVHECSINQGIMLF